MNNLCYCARGVDSYWAWTSRVSIKDYSIKDRVKRLLKTRPTSVSLALLPPAGLPCTILDPSGPLLVLKASSSISHSPSIDTAGLYLVR